MDAVTLDGMLGGAPSPPSWAVTWPGSGSPAPTRCSFESHGRARRRGSGSRPAARSPASTSSVATRLADLQELAGGEGAAAGRTRQALLLLRKHVNGARVQSLRRIPGERVVVIETGTALLALRLSGARRR